MSYYSSHSGGNKRLMGKGSHYNPKGSGTYNSIRSAGYYNKQNLSQYQRKTYSRANQYQNNYNSYKQAYGNRNADEQSFQLWMGDLNPKWDEDAIKNIWQAAGETPLSVKIVNDRTGERPTKQSYAFVTFNNQKIAEKALSKNGLQVPGSTRTFKLNWASGSNTSGVQSYSSNESYIKPSIKPENTIFVGDLNSDVTEQQLQEVFNKKYPGQVKQVKLMIDLSTGNSKGYGFVRFFNSSVRATALSEMAGYWINNRPIRVGTTSGSNSLNPSTKDPVGDSETIDYSKIHLTQVQPALNQFTDPLNSTIMVEGLSSRFTEDELAQHFLAYGDIIYCTLSTDLNTGYVMFYDRESAELALSTLYGQILNDCNLKFSWGKSEETSSAPVKFRPKITPGYTKARKPPPYYTTSQSKYTLRFDKEDPKKLKNLISEYDYDNQSKTVDNIDKFYVEDYIQRQKVLDSALL